MVCNNGITDEFPGAWGYQHELAECEGAWPLSFCSGANWAKPNSPHFVPSGPRGLSSCPSTNPA